ncbi:hypothetical protein N9U75_00190 [Pelagibacteraceae bacterium]|nr:hypothetical protein [Pelagibacteraceae bacterium]
MNVLKILNFFSADTKENKNISSDPQLIKYFKSEFGTSWKLELDKYIIRNGISNDKKVI